MARHGPLPPHSRASPPPRGAFIRHAPGGSPVPRGAPHGALSRPTTESTRLGRKPQVPGKGATLQCPAHGHCCRVFTGESLGAPPPGGIFWPTLPRWPDLLGRSGGGECRPRVTPIAHGLPTDRCETAPHRWVRRGGGDGCDKLAGPPFQLPRVGTDKQTRRATPVS